MSAFEERHLKCPQCGTSYTVRVTPGASFVMACPSGCTGVSTGDGLQPVVLLKDVTLREKITADLTNRGVNDWGLKEALADYLSDLGARVADWNRRVSGQMSKRVTGTGSADGRPRNRGRERTSTVGRGKAVALEEVPAEPVWSDGQVTLVYGDALSHYGEWDPPTVIVSDGGYGVLGFEGDTSDHLRLPEWYEPHVEQWARFALPSTTLWFWNSEIGWAAVHPVLEKYGFRYVNANIWNKGKGHIAGNVHTRKIRRFPVVTELCVQYVFEPRIDGRLLKHWLRDEWKRTGLPIRAANTACGVRDAAVRKYLDQGHLWYFPPPDKFKKLVEYANKRGERDGRPYFSIDGKKPGTAEQWCAMRAKFHCPHGWTNVWERRALRGDERVKVPGGRAVHLNQKPFDLTKLIIEASSDKGDVIWEPFGGLFTACLAAKTLDRRAFSTEIDATYYLLGRRRLIESTRQVPLL